MGKRSVRRTGRTFLLVYCCVTVCCQGVVEHKTSTVTQKTFSASELTNLSVVEAVDLLCDRAVTAFQYAEALLHRAQDIECLNVYAALDARKVLKAAEAIDRKAASGASVKPLCGFAFAVKDNIDVAGYPTTAGTPALESFVLESSSPLIDRLEEAHGIVLGKTRMHELAEGVTSISPHFGAVLNPYRPNVHTGGSSGGTAALVAARGAAAGFCTDTSGSCRIPASLTGVIGYRPTAEGDHWQQCYNAGSGLVPMTTTRDTVGLMARTIEDIKFLDSIFNDCPRHDWEVQLKGLRLGYATDWWSNLGEETEAAFANALEAITRAGVQLIKFNVTHMLEEQEENANDLFTYIYEMPRELSRYLFQHKYKLSLPELIDRIASPLVKASLEEWSYRDVTTWPTPTQYAHMLGSVVPGITQMWVEYFDQNNVDVMIVPTTPVTAREIGAAEPFSEINGRLENTMKLMSRTAEIDCPSSVPGLSMPIGLAADGLPIGLQLHSRPGDDGMMLAVAELLETILDKGPPPPRAPACQGCTSKVHLRTPSSREMPDVRDRVEAHAAAEQLSIYDFVLEGSCKLLQQGSQKDEL